jgi:hypothetical protein
MVARSPARSVRIRVCIALAAAILITSGIAAVFTPAQGVSAQSPNQTPSLTGLWLVNPFLDNPSASELALFTADGFVYSSQAPSMPSDPSSMQGTVLLNSQGFGVWQPDGARTGDFKFLTVAYDERGDYAGLTSIHGRLTVNDTGDQLSGTYTVTVFIPGSAPMDVVAGAAVTGTRVTVGSSP